MKSKMDGSFLGTVRLSDVFGAGGSNQEMRFGVVRHYVALRWQGRLPPLVSLFAVCVIQFCWTEIVSHGSALVQSGYSPEGASPVMVGVFIFVYNFLTVPVFAWWVVGSLRSAINEYSEAQRWLVPLLVAAVVVTFAIAEVASLAIGTWPRLVDTIEALAGDPEQGEKSVKILQGGRVAEVNGFLTNSLADDFNNAIRANPRIRTVLLNSEGGRISAAQKIRSTVIRNKLDTWVTEQCASACSDVFIAGKRRILSGSGRLGFHRPTLFGRDAPQQAEIEMDHAVSAGVVPSFILKAYAPGKIEMWYPTIEELESANVVTGTALNP